MSVTYKWGAAHPVLVDLYKTLPIECPGAAYSSMDNLESAAVICDTCLRCRLSGTWMTQFHNTIQGSPLHAMLPWLVRFSSGIRPQQKQMWMQKTQR